MTRGDAAISVTRGIADPICFGLDDAAAHRVFGQYPHELLADEKTSELASIDGRLCPLQQAQAHYRPTDYIPFDQMRAGGSGLERLTEILSLAGHFAVQDPFASLNPRMTAGHHRMIIPPYCAPPDQAAVQRYFRALARKVGLPIVLYIPRSAPI